MHAQRSIATQQQTASIDASPAMFFEEPQPSLEEEERRKRSRETIERDSLETFLKDLGREQQQGSGGSGGHTPNGVKHDSTAQSEEKGKRSYPADSSAAARTKAGRERARRERLNDRCVPMLYRMVFAFALGPIVVKRCLNEIPVGIFVQMHSFFPLDMVAVLHWDTTFWCLLACTGICL